MEKTKEKNINIGLQILRMISCFGVVTTHCYDSTWNKRLYYYLRKNPLHVPIFMFLSFHFYYKHISKRNIRKIILRFQRLLIPYIIWPLIFLIINNIYFIFFEHTIYGRYISLKDYIIQIIIGSNYFPLFWYLAVLLFLSILFTIFAFLFKKYYLFIIQLFGFFNYELHRSSIIYFLNLNNLIMIVLIFTIRFTPIAVFGVTIGSLDLISILKKNYIRNIIINTFFIYFLYKFQIFNFNTQYLYPDVDTNIIASINFFFIFSLLPIHRIINKKIILLLMNITNFTGGIYYLHLFINFHLNKIFDNVRNRTFFGTFIIYFFSYLTYYIEFYFFYNIK